MEVRSTLRRKGTIIRPRSASVPGREAGTSSFPLTFRPQSPPSSPAPDLPTPLGRARASQVFPSGKQLALRPHGGGARDRLKESAVRTHSLGPVPALVVQPPPLQGLPRFPPGPPGAALTAQQEEKAKRCGSPSAGRPDPRAASSALYPERGHRAASRRAEAAALRRARAGAPISPAPAAGNRAASSQGLGQRRPRGGRGRRPGPAGWRGSSSPTRPWRPSLPPPCGRWPTLSSSSPCGAGQLPS